MSRGAGAEAAPSGERPQFVGRAAELGSLRAIAGEVGRGAARIVLLEGEAGIGKSALVRRFAEIAAEPRLRRRPRAERQRLRRAVVLDLDPGVARSAGRPEIGAVRRHAPRSLEIVKRLVQSEAVADNAAVEASGRRLWLFDDVAEVCASSQRPARC